MTRKSLSAEPEAQPNHLTMMVRDPRTGKLAESADSFEPVSPEGSQESEPVTESKEKSNASVSE
jgi:hypothetical protein